MMNNHFQNEKTSVIEQLTAAGVPANHAEIVADCLVSADMYGVTSHGTAILPAHLERINRNGYNLSPEFKTLRETGAFAVIDGDNSMGMVCADYCISYAIEKARESGIFTVLSKNNNTLGPAFYYPLKAAEKGYIGIVMSNSPAQMAPFGGKEKMLGTNPFSVVIPCGDKEPLIIDMATSVTAKSKFKEYKNLNKPLPEGWALDKDGNPTTDPDEGMAGLVLPMAGFKGYGIALMIDVLAGVLSGAAFLNNVGRFYSEDNSCMNVGFSFVVINPEIVLGDNYKSIMEEYVCALRNSQAAKGNTIALPGDDRIAAYRKNTEKPSI